MRFPSVTVGTQGKKYLILDVSSLVRTRTDSILDMACDARAERTYLRIRPSQVAKKTLARRGPLT